MSHSFLHSVLLAIHIIAGIVSLLTAFAGVLSKAINVSHRVHVISGTAFVLGMGTIFLTGMPLAYMGSNIFLLMVGIFSGYLAWGGWRYARNRSGIPSGLDWAVVGLMALVGLGFVGYGAWILLAGNSFGTVAVVFGAISVFLCGRNAGVFRAGGATGKLRIAQHLTLMLGGTIAALTAFSANVIAKYLPANLEVIAWLWPTVLILPILIVWGRRVRAGVKISGMNH